MGRYGRILILAALALVAGVDVWPRLWAESGVHKHYLHQAQAFLRGRLDIDEAFGDVATYRGKHYVVFPPLPAVLITPLVAVFGEQTRTTVVSLALTALNVFVLRGILRRLEMEGELRRWLLAAFFLGTAYTTSHFQAYETWHFAHIVATSCLLLAIYEALGRGRAVLVGLCCGLAYLSRQLCIYSVVFLAVALWLKHKDKAGWAKLGQGVAFALPLGVCIGAYLLLNWLRFDDPFDAGYGYLPLTGPLAARVAKYGLFHPAYVPFNLTYLFLQGFHIDFTSPTLLDVKETDPWGTSLTFGSPFVFFALLARWQRPLVWAAWASILLPLLHGAFYFVNGFAQTNAQRYALDFLPILMLLAALGARRAGSVWWKAAIGYSIALNFVALFVVAWLKRLTAGL